jgi:ATPase subunit of ABC transporter with duplicated ATPase domains
MNSHKPIIISHISVSFLHKICFEDFSVTIYPGDHIALIGDNGSGKSTLLSLLAGSADTPHEGTIVVSPDVVIGYLPQNMQLDQDKTVWQVATAGIAQTIKDLQQFELLAQKMGTADAQDDIYDQLLEKLVASDAFDIENKISSLLQQMDLIHKKSDLVSTLSGGQQILLGLVRILATEPDFLLLDEPTNHLDQSNREKLFSFLHSWDGTAIIVSHDTQLLRTWPQKIWDIKHGEIIVFDGTYTDYVRERDITEHQQVSKIDQLKREKKKLAKEKEDDRAREAQSKKMGEKKYANAPRVLRNDKREQAADTTARKRNIISGKQEVVSRQLQDMYEHKVIVPTFDMGGQKQYGLLAISDGAVGYGNQIIVHDINLTVQPGERVAFVGDNGAGKSTIFKALLDANVRKGDGEWPSFVKTSEGRQQIGYLDQKYSILERAATPFDLIKTVRPEWSTIEIRSFLNDFLFCKNEEVSAPIATLSGGEKARLALAYIAAQSPSLLLLDEVTNNVDLTTRNHIVAVLNQFPGMILVISHDTDFLRAIGVERVFRVANGVITESVL